MDTQLEQKLEGLKKDFEASVQDMKRDIQAQMVNVEGEVTKLKERMEGDVDSFLIRLARKENSTYYVAGAFAVWFSAGAAFWALVTS